MEKALHRFQYEKAEGILKDLSKRLESNYPENCQYLETEKVRIEISRQHLTFADGIQSLISILEKTGYEKEIFTYNLTANEKKYLNFNCMLISKME